MKKKLFSLFGAAIFISCLSLVSNASDISEKKSPVIVPINSAQSQPQNKETQKTISQKVKNDIKQTEQNTKNAAKDVEKNVKKDMTKVDNKLKQTGKNIEQDTKQDINKLKKDIKK